MSDIRAWLASLPSDEEREYFGEVLSEKAKDLLSYFLETPNQRVIIGDRHRWGKTQTMRALAHWRIYLQTHPSPLPEPLLSHR